jgi:hypothetical protein
MRGPLLAGNDLRSMSAATKTILTNTEVIAVDQDPLGAQGTLVATPQSGLQVWSKPLSSTFAPTSGLEPPEAGAPEDFPAGAHPRAAEKPPPSRTRP